MSDDSKKVKFKKGDRIRRIAPGYPSAVTIGSIYEVTTDQLPNSSDVFITTDLGTIDFFYAGGFELVAQPDSAVKHNRLLTLPTDSNERKNYPLLSGCLNYFPAALAGVANVSKLGNDKHNPGEDLHHARNKSMDQGDCIVRHLIDVENLLAAAKVDSSVTTEAILLEVNQMAWRALAYSQLLHEKYGAPMAPAAKEHK